ncbi:hypothetical protein BH18ACT9_BH18ACT9_18740 [soil metagenome]
MAQDDDSDVRVMLLRSLMSKLQDDPYPSSTMMDTIEELLTPEDVPAYAKVLLDHVDDDQFPSVSLIERVKNLSGV